MVNKAINSAIEIVGSQQKLADACEVSQPTVWSWLHGRKKASAQNAVRIEKATGGKIQAYQIRPDLSELFPHPNSAA